MATVYGDIETCSHCNLKNCGAHIYAADPTTDVIYLCFAIDSGPVETWQSGMPVPAPFAAPAEHKFVFDNWTFEQLIFEHVLIPRHGFVPIPIENMDCAQRLALANAFPAELGKRCEALGLPYRKDMAARRAMLRLSRMHEYKRAEDKERDLALLLQRCKGDVEATRACYNHPRVKALILDEREQLLLDAKINTRGICANVPFLTAAAALAIKERTAIDSRVSELTDGTVTSIDQVGRLMETVNAEGHAMKTLGKRSVSATLAHKPEDKARELLELRQRGAFASARKFKALLERAGPGDSRIRGALRIFGAGPGRWSSLGAQLHNLMRNDAEFPASLVDALIAGNFTELARFGNPLKVIGQLSRAALCAAPGHELICSDYGAIESRIPAWFAGEEWKLAAFRKYDDTGDERLHPYRQTAARMLRKDLLAINKPERQMGKGAELACGFGGALGAWRKIANDEDTRSDDEVRAIVRNWRNAHPKICAFWQRLMRAARISIRTRQAVRVMPAPYPTIITDFDGTDFTITLPSSRAINYPNARLAANTKFENGDADIEFMDNARGQWKPVRGWFGIFVENVVQGTARDLLAAAIIRAEARGWRVVFHCHDELVIEAPIGTIPEKDALALLLEPPTWAKGLPLGGKVHSGPLYLEAPATAEPPTEPLTGTSPHVEPAEELPDDPAPAQHESPKFSNNSDEAIIAAATPNTDLRPPPPPPPPPPEEEAMPPPEDAKPASGNGRGDFSGFASGSKTEAEHDTYAEEHTGEPFDDAYLRRKGYQLVQMFDFMLPDYTLLYQQNRYELPQGSTSTKFLPRKRFLPHRKVDGKEILGAGDRLVIYNWPAIMRANPGSDILVPEGESNAKILIDNGLLATTVLSHKWTPECVAALTGHHLYILADHDKDGEKLAAAALKKLAPIAASARIISAVHLWKHLPGSKVPKLHDDVKDWIELERGDPAKLLDICREIPAAGAAILESVCAADVVIEDYDWIWPGRFALKKIGLITGLPDEGKGVLLSDIIAHVTRSTAWPCGEGQAPLGNVILLTAEDDISDTVIPRLMAAGADLARVTIIKMICETNGERMFSLVTDLPVLRKKVAEIGGVTMIVIDPIAAYLGLGQVDSFRATDVRAILGPLKECAEAQRLFILGIMHFNKKMDVTNLLLRVSDSLAYTAAARHVYGIVNDEDNDRKLFVKGKNNLAPREQKTLAFGFDTREVGIDRRTGNPIHRPFIMWHPDPVDITATEALRAVAEMKSPSARDNAKHFIEVLLGGGPANSTDVKEAAKENGISIGTLRRVAKELGVEVKKDGPVNEKNEITWRWHLPPKKEDEK
jgi:DNA polymerase